MFRYVAIIWKAADSRQQSVADALIEALQRRSTRWRTSFAAAGLKVLHAGESSGAFQAIPLGEGRGVVLGTLFPRADISKDTGPRAKARLGEFESRQICATGGRLLVDRYWGRYVAFFTDPSSHDKWVLRGPAMSLPCLRTQMSGVEIYFSSMKHCNCLEAVSFTVNWDQVVAQLFSMAPTGATGLNEISELRGGECIHITGTNRSKVSLWHPLPTSVSEEVSDLPEAIRIVRTVTQSCIHAWASCHGTLLHSLSGGLDSSIVLSCLKNAPGKPRVICFNQYADGSDTDEREFARLAANDAQTPLIERRRQLIMELDAARDVPKCAKPVDLFMSRETRFLESALAAETGAGAIFDGVGGDQLFWQNNSSLAVHDYVHRHGLRPSMLRVALNASRSDRILLWGLLYDTLRDKALSRRPTVLELRQKRRRLLGDEVSEILRQKDPFACVADSSGPGVPFGKIFHLHLLETAAELQDTYEADDSPEHVSPLLSQPLVEACLRIPTYVLTAHGIDRAAARLAFQHDVPRRIVLRRSKGGVTEYARNILIKNRVAVRHLLLEGELVKRNIIDRARIEEQLSDRPSGLIRGLVEIMRIIDTEVWVQQWLESTHRLTLRNLNSGAAYAM